MFTFSYFLGIDHKLGGFFRDASPIFERQEMQNFLLPTIQQLRMQLECQVAFELWHVENQFRLDRLKEGGPQ